MTQNALTKQLGKLADAVLADSRWQQDDLGVSILGMLLYGYALMVGRNVMLLDIEEIDAAVFQCMTNNIGAAVNWSTGFVAEAHASALDENNHPGHHELIGVGHSYFGVENQSAVVENIFQNIEAFR